jgi:hypothetical protein
MNEHWIDIPNLVGKYQVSNLGNVRSLDMAIMRSNGWIFNSKGRVLKQAKDHRGYLRCALSSNDGKLITYKVHRLVAEAFCSGKCHEKNEVNHIDGNKTNNNAINLEWVDRSYNVKHSFDIGLQIAKRGELNGNSKLKSSDIKHIRDEYNYLNGKRGIILKLSKGYGIDKKTISQIIKKEIWRHV